MNSLVINEYPGHDEAEHEDDDQSTGHDGDGGHVHLQITARLSALSYVKQVACCLARVLSFSPHSWSACCNSNGFCRCFDRTATEGYKTQFSFCPEIILRDSSLRVESPAATKNWNSEPFFPFV